MRNSDSPWTYLLMMVAVVAICIVGFVVSSVMEARTFRKLTGRTDVTWWDALWVNLRVDDD